MATPADDDRDAEIFRAIELRIRRLAPLVIAATIAFAMAGAAFAVATIWYVQAAVLDFEFAFIPYAGGALGAWLGILGGKTLQRALIASSLPGWRRELAQALGATDSEIDDAVAMLR